MSKHAAIPYLKMLPIALAEDPPDYDVVEQLWACADNEIKKTLHGRVPSEETQRTLFPTSSKDHAQVKTSEAKTEEKKDQAEKKEEAPAAAPAPAPAPNVTINLVTVQPPNLTPLPPASAPLGLPASVESIDADFTEVKDQPA